VSDGTTGIPNMINGTPNGVNDAPNGTNGMSFMAIGIPDVINDTPNATNGAPNGTNGTPNGANGASVMVFDALVEPSEMPKITENIGFLPLRGSHIAITKSA
jgi:hypothetical protein